MNYRVLKEPFIKIINTYLQNNRHPHNIKIDNYIKNIDDLFVKTKPINHQMYLYINVDLLYDKNKHKSQLFSYHGLYRGYLLTNLYQNPNMYNSKEFQKIILKIDVSKESKCLLLNDTSVLLNRNSIISITSINKFIVNISYKPL
jgi:hypothetical protein